jgi:lipopolysaccharide transport system ATP-binding protein
MDLAPGAIRVDHLGKSYQIYDRPPDRLKQAIVPRVLRLVGRAGPTYYREFWALQGVSFEVRRGESVGILGRNGAGKSTLLQIIAGTLAPTLGQVAVDGRVGALLELGSGFNPEFTGRENVFLNASLLGLSADQTREKFDQIASFADIGNFIEQPVKTYSSGMIMRLAFAVQTTVVPEVMIVDEALAVGDVRFQKKCYERLESFRADGGTVLFVTHDTNAVVQLCTKAMILEAGHLLEYGEPHQIAKSYHRLLFGGESVGVRPEAVADERAESDGSKAGSDLDQVAAGDHSKVRAIKSDRELAYGSKEIVISEIGIRDRSGGITTLLELGQEYTFYFRALFTESFGTSVAFGFTITNPKGIEVYGTKGQQHGLLLPGATAGSEVECRMALRMILVPGVYFLSVAVAPEVDLTPGGDSFFHYRFDALEFRVIGNPACFTTSIVDLGGTLSVQEL